MIKRINKHTRHSLSERIVRTPGADPRGRHILTLNGISTATEEHSAAIRHNNHEAKTRDPRTSLDSRHYKVTISFEDSPEDSLDNENETRTINNSLRIMQ